MNAKSLFLQLSLLLIGTFSFAQHAKFIIIEAQPQMSQKEWEAREKVAKEWNIEFRRQESGFQGSMVEDSIALHNGMTFYRLSEKFGKDWEKKFNEAVVNELNSRQDMKEVLLLSLHETKEYNQLQDKIVLGVHYESNSTIPYKKNISKETIRGDSQGHLFRWSDNIVRFDFATEINYEFITKNCELTKYVRSGTLPPYEFNLTSNNLEKNAYLMIVSERGDTTSFIFKITQLPVASFHFGYPSPDNKLSVSRLSANDSLYMAFPPGLSMKGYEQEVIEWELQYENKRHGPIQHTAIIGEEMLSLIKNLPVGSSITIYYKARSEEGIIRSSYLDYTLEP